MDERSVRIATSNAWAAFLPTGDRSQVAREIKAGLLVPIDLDHPSPPSTEFSQPVPPIAGRRQ
jgi:hypothetical protein